MKPSRERAPDPLAAVLALGRGTHLVGLAVGLAVGLIVHGAAAGHGYQLSGWLEVKAFAADVRRNVADKLKRKIDVDLEREEREPEPEPEPEPVEEPEPPPKPPDAPKPPPDAPPPPPAAAEAAKVLTAEPDPDEPLDLTDTTFVSGSGERYVGGITASTGKSKRAVYDQNARPDGEVGGTGKKPAPVYQGPDLSAPIQVNVSALTNCGFPPEADVEQINFMKVPITLVVGPDGRAQSVTILEDVGHGFGRRAKRCAMRAKHRPAADRSGKPITSTIRVNVRFTR